MALLEQIGLGIYLGILTGMFTALLVFGLAFSFQYIAGIAFPAATGLMIGLGAAGLQGGLFRLMRDPVMLQSPVIITALLIVMLISGYAQKRGVDLAKAVPPKTVIFSGLRRRGLSRDVVKRLGRFGQVMITVPGEVGDMEGYPPLADEIRDAIGSGTWQFPADLPLAELEARLREQLLIEFHLDDAAVSISPRGEAKISAAPPARGLSRRVPVDRHAVTLEAMVPTGAAYGDRARVSFSEEELEGMIVSVTPPEVKEKFHAPPPPVLPLAQTAGGGEGRLALAVDPEAVESTVDANPDQFIILPRGKNREYELISLLRQQGNAFRKLRVKPDGPFTGKRMGSLGLRRRFGVDVLAIKQVDTWSFAPRSDTRLFGGNDLFVTGPDRSIADLEEAMA